MTITSKFYTGPVNNIQWSSGVRALPYRYMVRSIDDFKVTVNGAITRGFSVSAGVAAGAGIEDTNDAVISGAPQALPLHVSDRWWLIGLRRTWGATKATMVDWIAGTGTEAIPVRPETPGIEDFQPLALAFVPANGTAITVLRDLRVVADNGGTMIAFSDLVRDFINTPGTQLRIVGATAITEWTRGYTTALGLTWTSANVSNTADTGWVPITTVLSVGWTSSLQGRRIGSRVELKGEIDPNGSHWGAINNPIEVVTALPANFAPASSRVFLLASGTPNSAGISFRMSLAANITLRCSATNHAGSAFINVSYLVD